MDTSKMFICSECVHSNSDVRCLKHLLNYCRHFFPLQTIKTTPNPEKDKTSPLVVMKVSRKSLLLLPLGNMCPTHKNQLSGLTPIGSHGGSLEVNSGCESPRLFLDSPNIPQLSLICCLIRLPLPNYFKLHLEMY